MSRLEYETYKKIVGIITSKRTLIAVDGGGNLGTLWPVEDECIRDVIGRFQNNPVIVFPQTAHYEDMTEGKALFERTVGLINRSDNLLFMFRDEKSFAMFKGRADEAKIMLCPDIVTYVDDAATEQKTESSKKAGICFRDDKENVMSQHDREMIISYIKSAGMEPCLISTIAQANVHATERNEALKSKWDEFKECDIVITDRLHGMIFSAITGTKCIAFDNVSKKVYGGYQWLKALDYVQYCNGYEEFEKIFDMLAERKKCEYTREMVIGSYFDKADAFITNDR